MATRTRAEYIDGLKANIDRSKLNIAECKAALSSADPKAASILREMIALHERFINVRQAILADLDITSRHATAA